MSYIAFSDLFYIFFHYHDQFELSELPDLLIHRVFPQLLWPTSDTAVAIAYFMTISIYFCLFFAPHLEFRWLMFLFVDGTGKKKVEIFQTGRFLKQDEVTRIYQLRTKGENLSSIRAFKLHSVHDFLLLVVVFPFVPYLLFTNFILIYFFVLTSRYLRAKQKCAAEKLKILEKNDQTLPSWKTSKTFWYNFQKLNSSSVAFQKELNGQNKFWQSFLSIYFSVYMVETCYLSYCFFFLSTTADITTCVIFSASCNFVVILFYVTLQCSRIVNTKVTMFRQTMRMAVQKVASDKKDLKEFKKVLCYLMKINLMAANEQFAGEDVSFTLITGHLINSTMFQSVATYTLMFFMIVFKDNENIQ
ncbi:hypothetical protein TYRP_016031 [Tyrophagus putrescentiae]|nr:hypothetical protein TYRP_016031 [Tyrophagus putrescentiae]